MFALVLHAHTHDYGMLSHREQKEWVFYGGVVAHLGV